MLGIWILGPCLFVWRGLIGLSVYVGPEKLK